MNDLAKTRDPTSCHAHGELQGCNYDVAAVMKRDNALRALGLARDAIITPALLRTAYKTAVLRTHPDRPGGSAEAFRAVQAARAELEAVLDMDLDSQRQRRRRGYRRRRPRWRRGQWDDAEIPGAATDDWTPDEHALYEASWHDDTEVALGLLARGARPDAYRNDQWGGTCLMLAAAQGNVALCAALLRSGASPFRRDFNRRTASTWARRRGHSATVALLGAWIRAWHRGQVPSSSPSSKL